MVGVVMAAVAQVVAMEVVARVEAATVEVREVGMVAAEKVVEGRVEEA